MNCHVGIDGKAHLDLAGPDGEVRRYSFDDANELLDLAEEMKLAGYSMLRHERYDRKRQQ